MTTNPDTAAEAAERSAQDALAKAENELTERLGFRVIKRDYQFISPYVFQRVEDGRVTSQAPVQQWAYDLWRECVSATAPAS